MPDTRRILIVTDDELLLLIGWGEVARSEPRDGVLHDWDDDDDELIEKLEAARLR